MVPFIANNNDELLASSRLDLVNILNVNIRFTAGYAAIVNRRFVVEFKSDILLWYFAHNGHKLLFKDF